MDGLNFSQSEAADEFLPILDLNELLLLHPGASYLFQRGEVLFIVDRAIAPSYGSIIILKSQQSFVIEPYHGQEVWGVVTHRVHKVFTV